MSSDRPANLDTATDPLQAAAREIESRGGVKLTDEQEALARNDDLFEPIDGRTPRPFQTDSQGEEERPSYTAPNQDEYDSSPADDSSQPEEGTQLPEWVTDDVFSLAASSGIDPVDVENMASLDEFHRTLRYARPSAAQDFGGAQEPEGGIPETEKVEIPTIESMEEQYRQTLLEKDIEENTVEALVAANRGMFEDQLAAKQQLAEVQNVMVQGHELKQQEYWNHYWGKFDGMIDSLESDQYGQNGRLTEVQKGDRLELAKRFRILEDLEASEGKQVDQEALFEQVVASFGNQSPNRRSSATRQTRRRRPTANRKATTAQTTAEEEKNIGWEQAETNRLLEAPALASHPFAQRFR